jgi:hypothetical protein
MNAGYVFTITTPAIAYKHDIYSRNMTNLLNSKKK